MVPAENTEFDDSVVETLEVAVTSTSDSTGLVVACVETAPASRLFRSTEPILVDSEFARVQP